MEKGLYFLQSLEMGIMVLDENHNIIFLNDWIKIRLEKDSCIKEGGNLVSCIKDHDFDRFHECLNNLVYKRLSYTLSHKLNSFPFKLFFGETELNFSVVMTPMSLEGQYFCLQIVDKTQVYERERYLVDRQAEFDKEVASIMGELKDKNIAS